MSDDVARHDNDDDGNTEDRQVAQKVPATWCAKESARSIDNFGRSFGMCMRQTEKKPEEAIWTALNLRGSNELRQTCNFRKATRRPLAITN